MNIKIFFSIISVLIGLAAFYPYFKDVLAKKTKPHEFTWLIWALTQGTATAALWYGGGGVGAIGLTISTFLVVVMFILSLFNGTRDIKIIDIILLIIALSAILVWWQMDNPLLSVFMVSGIDLVGYIPTFRKSFNNPWSETLVSWLVFTFANIFALLALQSYNLLTTTYLVAISTLNISLFLFLTVRRKFVKKPF